MKKFLLLLSFITLFFSAFSQTIWTVSSVPNTRLQSNDIHVSDPDGYLSDSVEMQINTALCAIRDKADVFVVTLNSIGSSDPKHFATALFNEWGIGDAAFRIRWLKYWSFSFNISPSSDHPGLIPFRLALLAVQGTSHCILSLLLIASYQKACNVSLSQHW